MARDKEIEWAIGGCCCCSVLITIIVLIAISFSSLEQLEYGLNYNSISLQIEKDAYQEAGLFMLGVGHYFIKYPRTIQMIEFSADDNGRLQTRTSDGLPVKLSISFQYRYQVDKLRELYYMYKGEEVEVYENTAKAVIANAATNFSAYTFFNDKQGIATEMQMKLTDLFNTRLMASIIAFQITRVELPNEFQNAILQSIEAKQNITRTQRYMENMQVTFAQQVLVANQTKQQTVALAYGSAAQRAERADATATVIAQSVEAEMYAYGNLTEHVELNVSEGLSYIWWSTQLTKTNKEYLVGLDPSAMIRSR